MYITHSLILPLKVVFIIPLIEKKNIDMITKNISTAFEYKKKKKELIMQCQNMIEQLCDDNI